MLVVNLRADAIREMALRRNLSIREVAELSGVQPSHLPALMRGGHRPSPRLRRRLLSALDLTFDELFVLSRTEP